MYTEMSTFAHAQSNTTICADIHNPACQTLQALHNQQTLAVAQSDQNQDAYQGTPKPVGPTAEIPGGTPLGFCNPPTIRDLVTPLFVLGGLFIAYGLFSK